MEHVQAATSAPNFTKFTELYGLFFRNFAASQDCSFITLNLEVAFQILIVYSSNSSQMRLHSLKLQIAGMPKSWEDKLKHDNFDQILICCMMREGHEFTQPSQVSCSSHPAFVAITQAIVRTCSIKQTFLKISHNSPFFHFIEK